MNLTKTFSVIRQFNCRGVSHRLTLRMPDVRCASSASSSSIEEVSGEDSAVGKEKKIMEVPFVKNLFAGVFNERVLEYPEYPSLEYIKEVDRMTAPVEDYFTSVVNSKEIDEKMEISEQVLKTIKEHGLYALQVPKRLGGIELDDKCFARFFESIGTEPSVSTCLTSHYRAVYVLLVYGTEQQKEKLIPLMTSGELKVSLCLVEKPNIIDVSDIETTALPDTVGNWVLNGKKLWVTDGDKADYFLVFAKTWRGSNDTPFSSELSLILVDRNTPGVSCGVNLKQVGTRGVGLCDVEFTNVVVAKENIVGEVGSGSEMAMQCLSRGRLGSAAASVGYIKQLINSLTDFINNNKVGGKALYMYEYYQKQLGRIAVDLYALESMVYLTAGLKDTYEDADLSLEDAIIQVFSMEKIVEIVDVCALVTGGSAYIVGSPLERSIRDARAFLLHDIVPINVTKSYIATLGLHHAGKNVQQLIKKARNPLNFPSFALKHLFINRKGIDSEKVPELLRLNLHPSLAGDADKLEQCVLCLEGVVIDLMRRWGIEVVNRHLDLIKLTDCVISMYAMTAILGRASRAYCIGLNDSNFDLAASNVFCGIHCEKVKNTVEEIYGGPMESYDTPCLKLGEQVALKRGYFFEHPLARNY